MKESLIGKGQGQSWSRKEESCKFNSMSNLWFIMGQFFFFLLVPFVHKSSSRASSLLFMCHPFHNFFVPCDVYEAKCQMGLVLHFPFLLIMWILDKMLNHLWIKSIPTRKLGTNYLTSTHHPIFRIGLNVSQYVK